MFNTVEEYLKATFNPDDKYNVRSSIECGDGTTISVQGGTKYHYCEPNEHCNVYNKVEVLVYDNEFGEVDISALERDKTSDDVYGYVDIDKVERFVKEHGGIARINKPHF